MSIEDVNLIAEKNIRKKNSKDEKLILIDFYTDWCGWCKKLDKDTYQNAEVINLMNEYFYSVKFNAEQRDSVSFIDKTYKFKPSGSRGTHELALAFAAREGRIGYPTITILNSKGEKVAVEAGYRNAEKMQMMLRYYGEGHYKSIDLSTYEAQVKQQQLTD
jgi:thioredoxin-related protein